VKSDFVCPRRVLWQNRFTGIQFANAPRDERSSPQYFGAVEHIGTIIEVGHTSIRGSSHLDQFFQADKSLMRCLHATGQADEVQTCPHDGFRPAFASEKSSGLSSPHEFFLPSAGQFIKSYF
jgi:hypothetical protein